MRKNSETISSAQKLQPKLSLCESHYISYRQYQKDESQYSAPLCNEMQKSSFEKQNQYIVSSFIKRLKKIQANKLIKFSNESEGWQYEGEFIETQTDEQIQINSKEKEIISSINSDDTQKQPVAGQQNIQLKRENKIKRHGLGLLKNKSDCFLYLGEWKDDNKSGSGIEICEQSPNREISMSSSYRFEGFYDQNVRIGFGILKEFSGDKYMGDFKDNLKHGKGQQYYAVQHQTYSGQFHCGKKHGHGSYLYKNGDIFQGTWYNDLKQGKGVHIYYNGDIFKGYWFNNYIQGQGTFHYKNGDYFIGCYSQGIKKGKGRYYFKEGHLIQATWKDEDAAFGQIFYTNGDIYLGEIYKGEKHGYGKYLYYGDRSTFEGFWHHDEKHGRGVMENRMSQVIDFRDWAHNRPILKKNQHFCLGKEIEQCGNGRYFWSQKAKEEKANSQLSVNILEKSKTTEWKFPGSPQTIKTVKKYNQREY